MNVAAAPSFNPQTGWTTDPIHSVWASDPSWSAPADGGAVSSWRNGGSVGGDLVQATGSRQPTYRAATVAFNSQPTVQFDGSADVLAVDPADVAQTYYLVIVGSLGGSGRIVGFGADTTYGFGSNGAWILRTGASAITAGTPGTDPHLMVVKAAGASSAITVDGTSIVTGNAAAGALTVLSLGAANVDTSTFGNYVASHIAYAAVFNTDPTALPEWAEFYAMVEEDYGIPLP